MNKEIVYYRVGASLTTKDLLFHIEEIWVQNVTDKNIVHSGNKRLKVEDLNKVDTSDSRLFNGNLSTHIFVKEKEGIPQAKEKIIAYFERLLDKYQTKLNENRVAVTKVNEMYRSLD